jgi:hypothetical protein
MLKDCYGGYTPSDPLPPVPPFPCSEYEKCSVETRLCERHTRVLFVKVLDQNTGQFQKTIEIPFGRWENWDWYHQRIVEATGIPAGCFTINFAGLARSGTQRHSGLQSQSSIFCIIRKEEEK